MKHGWLLVGIVLLSNAIGSCDLGFDAASYSP